jgi:hypothetical protein
MKKLLTIHVCLFLLISLTNAQAPQALNYQAVARTADGVIIPTQNIGVRFSILDANVTGTVLFSETHTTTTNPYGLFTLAIGKGTPVTSTFASINWASGTDKFLKVEIAPTGGNNYQLQGTTQLLSVPYALYSEKTRLIAGNNTISISNGNTITGNYQAGTGINITGNTISHNLVAGTGISITGNTITNTATNPWVTDANGINYQAGSVGIGMTSAPGSRLTIQQTPTGGFSGAMDITSADTYHTVFRFRNTTVNQEWQFMVGGSGNIYQRPGTLAIFNTRTLRWPFYIDPNNENIGVGSNSATMPDPKSRLHVFNGDVNIDQIGSGIILKSPNGNCWRVTIDNSGNLIRTAITCPN